jgi:hypothetical protein
MVIATGKAMKSLELLLLKPLFFPLEVTLSSGEKHVLPHPDHVWVHRKSKDLVIYSDEDREIIRLIIDPVHGVSAVPINKQTLLKEES